MQCTRATTYCTCAETGGENKLSKKTRGKGQKGSARQRVQ
jgi:hypothetical protein